jgi:hypothetical protein
MTSLENFDIESWFRAKYVKSDNGKVCGYDISYEDMLQVFIADKKNMIATECGTGLWSPAMECVIGWKEVHHYQKGRDMLADLQKQLMKLEREREEEQRRNSVEYNLNILKEQTGVHQVIIDARTMDAMYNLIKNIDRRLSRMEHPTSYYSS